MRSVILALILVIGNAALAADIAMPIAYLKVETETPPTLSNLDTVPEDLGVAGAHVGLKDNATTGRFLGHDYTLVVTQVALGEDPVAAARDALKASPYLTLDAPWDVQLAIADLPEAADALLFNVSAPEGQLRGEDCRANLFHTAPSYAMRTDALVQFLVKRRWDTVVLIKGAHERDTAYAASLRDSLTKFGLALAEEKTWVFDADMRRNAAQEVPLFTQDFPEHDVLLIADEIHDFGRYVAYNTWEATPLAGSEGLTAEAWAPVVEQWGAAQLQSRFHEASGREMAPRDYAAWAAMRVLSEAVTRTNSDDPQTLRAFILGPDFELAGFKGRPLSFRTHNGQMRQPIPLTHPRALVAMAPIEGFLHQVNELDTLGQDQPESTCTAFGDR